LNPFAQRLAPWIRHAALAAACLVLAQPSMPLFADNPEDFYVYALVAAQPSMPPFAGSSENFYVYTPPAGAVGAPGTLIRYQPHTDTGGQVVPNHYRVLYWSTARLIRYGSAGEDLSDCETQAWDQPGFGVEYRCYKPIVTSGLVRIPDAAPPPGGFATVAFSHGTVGVIPHCGPSRGFGPQWRDWMASDQVKNVAADYPGLGYDAGLRSVDADYRSKHPWYFGFVWQQPFDETSHTYSDNWSPAAATIDAVRAGQQLEAVLAGLTAPQGEVGANPSFVVTGSSQGGSVAIATGIVMGEGYAPELQLEAVLAGTPGSDLASPAHIDSSLAYGVIAAGVVGASITDPAIRPSEWFTTIGQANYQRTSEQVCSGAHDLESYLWWINVFYSYPFVADAGVLTSTLPWQRYGARQRLYGAPTQAPVFIGHVDDDPLNPIARTDLLVQRLRTDPGSPPVTYCVYEGNGNNSISLEGMENHTGVLDRMGVGDYLTCTGPDGQPMGGNLSTRQYLANHGFPWLL
jgi:hypothetical protein